MRLLIYCLFVTFFPPQTRCCLNMEFLGKHMYIFITLPNCC